MALGHRSPRRTTLPRDSGSRKRLHCTGRVDRFRAGRRLLGMYGPPPRRKRKVRVTGWSTQMYSAFVGAVAPGQDGMRCALFPFSLGSLGRLLPSSGFENAGSSVVQPLTE